MSYIGSTPTTQSFISGTDYFNGDGTTTAFTLSRRVNSVNDIEVLVNNVEQQPNTVYSVNTNTLTFTTAPSSGTQNIYVRYLSTTTQVIVPSQGTVNTAQLGLITTIPTTGGNTITLPASTGTVALTTTPVTSSQLPSGSVLQIVTQNDAGSSTSSTTRVNLNGSTVSITPKSTNSKIIIEVGFNGFIGYAGAGTNSTGTFDISEGSTAVSFGLQTLSVASASGINAQINAPSYLIAVVTNSALTARSFTIYGKTSSSAALASATGMTWKITEVAN